MRDSTRIMIKITALCMVSVLIIAVVTVLS